jgi:hypothetical protein
MGRYWVNRQRENFHFHAASNTEIIVSFVIFRLDHLQRMTVVFLQRPRLSQPLQPRYSVTAMRRASKAKPKTNFPRSSCAQWWNCPAQSCRCEKSASEADLKAYMKARGFHMVISGDQYVILCHQGDFKLICSHTITSQTAPAPSIGHLPDLGYSRRLGCFNPILRVT